MVGLGRVAGAVGMGMGLGACEGTGGCRWRWGAVGGGGGVEGDGDGDGEEEVGKGEEGGDAHDGGLVRSRIGQFLSQTKQEGFHSLEREV